MKNTFKFLAFAVVASLLSFTSCKDDPDGTEGGGQEQTGSVTFNFDGAVAWTPQSVHLGYESDEEETYVMGVATKDPTTREQFVQMIEGIDLDNNGIPKDVVLLGFYGVEGTQNCEGNILEEDGDLTVILINGVLDMGEDMLIPTGWVSTNMLITITDFDMVTNKMSATITTTMGDILYILSEGMVGTPDEKTFTINITNYDIFDLEDYYAEDLEKLLKK